MKLTYSCEDGGQLLMSGHVDLDTETTSLASLDTKRCARNPLLTLAARNYDDLAATARHPFILGQAGSEDFRVPLARHASTTGSLTAAAGSPFAASDQSKTIERDLQIPCIGTSQIWRLPPRVSTNPYSLKTLCLLNLHFVSWI